MEILTNIAIFYCSITGWALLMVLILWPINDKPTSSGQKSVAIISTIAIAFLAEWLIKTIN